MVPIGPWLRGPYTGKIVAPNLTSHEYHDGAPVVDILKFAISQKDLSESFETWEAAITRHYAKAL